jgi:hypothetical protein
MEEFCRLVVGVDPSGGDKKINDEQGTVGVGKTYAGQGYVLADRRCKLKTHGWSRRAVQLAIDIGAEPIVVEKNFGGDMAISPLEQAAEELGWKGKIKAIFGSRGKRVRAEPVAALYGDPDDPETWDQAVMHHVGNRVGEPWRDQRSSDWSGSVWVGEPATVCRSRRVRCRPVRPAARGAAPVFSSHSLPMGDADLQLGGVGAGLGD